MRRLLLAGILLVLGSLSCGYGLLILLSIPNSDTATYELVIFGGSFVAAGLVLVAVAVAMSRRSRH
jgi:hypothetical protein